MNDGDDIMTITIPKLTHKPLLARLINLLSLGAGAKPSNDDDAGHMVPFSSSPFRKVLILSLLALFCGRL